MKPYFEICDKCIGFNICAASIVNNDRLCKKFRKALKLKSKVLCDSCNMINCKLQIEYGIKAVKCNECME